MHLFRCLYLLLFVAATNSVLARKKSIKFVTYNILAEAYINPVYYPHVEPTIWQDRKGALVTKIKNLCADIICLQEVEKQTFDAIEISLGKKYTSIFAKKQEGKPDGCALFLSEKVTLRGHKVFAYHDGSATEKNSGHIALIAYCTINNVCFGIVNTHIRWDEENKPCAQHAGCREITELVAELKNDTTTSRWIICGDFNAEPESELVKKMVESGFIDAYKEKPQPTVHINGLRRIDYIFHTPTMLITAYPIPVLTKTSILPSKQEPSDHLALEAVLQI